MSRAKNWCFTINNWTEAEAESLRTVGTSISEYLVFGKETGEEGTPHLQGFVTFKAPLRFSTAKNRIGERAHLAVARAGPSSNREYCIKEGDFEEFGTCPPSSQGRRTDLDTFYDWADTFSQENGRAPSTPEVARHAPAILTRYPGAVAISRIRFEGPPLAEGEPWQWQADLRDELLGETDPRHVLFYVDPEGGKGKTWFIQWFFSQYKARTQVLGIAKRDDMAHMISPSKSVFLINVPRTQMEYLQYSILEMLKDRMVSSPKYNSRMKVLDQVPHVVVFSNEAPDLSKMTMDRYVVREINVDD